ncbi:UbiA family prenyltransferase [Cognatishimia sp. WU-CL00825]
MTGELLPLYVDLDGTLVKTDVAQELMLQVATKPSLIPSLLRSLTQGVSQTKLLLSEKSTFDPETLPYNTEVLDYLSTQKSLGRRIVLASATDRAVAHKVANHLGIFDSVIASSAGNNLKGLAKLKAIQADCNGEFEYIGDSSVDIPIWQAAKVCGFVNAPDSARKMTSDSQLVSVDIQNNTRPWQSLLKAMRPHQWAKNALILLPLFFSHSYDAMDLMMRALLAVLIFSICASAIYIFNDLMDIESDRAHAKKKSRPFAAGDLQPIFGVAAGIVMLMGGLGLSMLYFGWPLTALFGFYIVITTLYSTWLKHKPVIDVVVLTCLYTLRIFVGGVAIGAALSPWLLNFSLFFFASLAFMKRYTEMRRVEAAGKLKARGYLVDDMDAIRPMGISCGGLAVLTLTLYLNSSYVAETYNSPQILWLIAPVTMFWIFRAWLRALRDEIDDDPVVFALKDRTSRLVLLLAVAIVITSRFLNTQGITP